MQSRFSAFVVRQPGYLLDTWQSSTRPQHLELDDDQQWLLLEIVETTKGGLFDPTGVVEFRAHYRAAGTRGVMRERSNFIREDGRWRYLSGEQKQ
jgi:SEC-C motif-containing protein